MYPQWKHDLATCLQDFTAGNSSSLESRQRSKESDKRHGIQRQRKLEVTGSSIQITRSLLCVVLTTIDLGVQIGSGSHSHKVYSSQILSSLQALNILPINSFLLKLASVSVCRLQPSNASKSMSKHEYSLLIKCQASR